MKKVYCFWLDEEVPVHDASAVFNPLNGVCWDCRACIDAMERREENGEKGCAAQDSRQHESNNQV